MNRIFNPTLNRISNIRGSIQFNKIRIWNHHQYSNKPKRSDFPKKLISLAFYSQSKQDLESNMKSHQDKKNSHISSIQNASEQNHLMRIESYLLSQQIEKLSLNELISQITYWKSKNHEFLYNSIFLKSNIRQQSTPKINQQGPIFIINRLILLLSQYHSRMYSSQPVQTSKETYDIINHEDQWLSQVVQQITSSLHFIVSSQQYNLDSFPNDSQFQEQILQNSQPFPHVGSLLKILSALLLENSSFNLFKLETLNQKYMKYLMLAVQVMELYTSSYGHFIVSVMQHLYVYEACNKLTKLNLNLSSQKFTSQIKAKYQTKHLPQKTIHYHKQYKCPQVANNTPKPARNKLFSFTPAFAYNEVNSQYFLWVQQQANSELQNLKITKVMKNLQSIMDKMMIFSDEKRPNNGEVYGMIKNLKLYVEWVRLFVLYEEIGYSEKQNLMSRLLFLIKMMSNTELKQLIKTTHPQFTQKQLHQDTSLHPTTNQLKQTYLYLIYFYHYLLQPISNKNQQQLQSLNEYIKQIIFSSKNIHIIFSSLQSSQNHNLTISPKTQCIRLEIYLTLLELEFNFSTKVDKYGKDKEHKSMIQKLVLNQLKRDQLHLKLNKFPFVFLTWYHSTCLSILEFIQLVTRIQSNSFSQTQQPTQKKQGKFDTFQSQLEQIHQIKTTLLQKTIDCLKLDTHRLSPANTVHSLFPLIKQILYLYQTSDNIQNHKNSVQQLIDWLNSHSRQELLTQDQNDICNLIQYLLPFDDLVIRFFDKVVEISFGEYSWQSFNRLYYFSLFLYPPHQNQQKTIGSQSSVSEIKELKQNKLSQPLMNIQYVRRYILNEYTAMGIRRRQIPTTSYFYKILELSSPQSFYRNYFVNHGH